MSSTSTTYGIAQPEQDITRLRAMADEGLASGPATADTDADWAELDAIALGSIEQADHVDVLRLVGQRQQQSDILV